MWARYSCNCPCNIRDAQSLKAKRSAAGQRQFLDVQSAEQALENFRSSLKPQPLGIESVPLAQALGRVVAQTIESPVDVPGFDEYCFRSLMRFIRLFLQKKTAPTWWFAPVKPTKTKLCYGLNPERNQRVLNEPDPPSHSSRKHRASNRGAAATLPQARQSINSSGLQKMAVVVVGIIFLTSNRKRELGA